MAPVFIVGATGAGKSEVAMALARRHGAAILAMDAMQVYRGANIGTSKPSAAERAEIPHGGLDLVGLGQSFDVAQYLEHAALFLREQRETGKPVIIVGGTGLYFRALTRGLCEAPQGSDELRAKLNELSVEELRERLKRVDPAMLERVDGANPRRLVRAIEVMEETGRSLRDWQDKTPEPLVKEFAAFWIEREKKELEERIKQRVEAMFAAGWVEEVRGLVEKHGMEAVKSFPGIGYREIAEAMELRGQERSQVQLGNEEGKIIRGPSTAPRQARLPLRLRSGLGLLPRLPKDDSFFESRLRDTVAGSAMVAVKSDILVATRQYAKRQLTWFAREPNLQKVMLSGTQPLPAALLTLF